MEATPAQGPDPHPGPDPHQVAAALRVSVGLLVRRLRQAKSDGHLTLPESSALARIDRGGPTTSAALAKVEQISPQSMGTTLGGLERRGLVERRPDPDDGRRVVLSLTEAGRAALASRRQAGTGRLAEALSTGFDGPELELLEAAAPLIERLAELL
jgi:DNA-binding MarR family transcriptional regulator